MKYKGKFIKVNGEAKQWMDLTQRYVFCGYLNGMSLNSFLLDRGWSQSWD